MTMNEVEQFVRGSGAIFHMTRFTATDISEPQIITKHEGSFPHNCLALVAPESWADEDQQDWFSKMEEHGELVKARPRK